jgi:hypothetical protein
LRLFGRDEAVHLRLAREAAFVERLPPDVRPPLETGIHGLQRPREWDATLTADAPGVEGDTATFVALPDGSLLVEDGPDSSLDAIAAAVERTVPPPYRARAARQRGDLWAVQARRIEVMALPDAPAGEALDVTHTTDGNTELRVDGELAFGSVAALEHRGAREGSEYSVHAERLDGDLWEVRAAAL